MKVYAPVHDVHMPLAAMPAHARRVEALGYDGLIVPEAVHDGILYALLALEHTERITVTTGVVVAFARSPMLLAQDAWALQAMSGGRFELGLGPQVKGNVERRYGMPWSAPAPRMRDYVGALRAIFECWQKGGALDYRSDSYVIDRMQPFFNPGPIDHPDIPIALGAIGPGMTKVAGEIADVVIAHPTNSSPAYLGEAMRPKLAEGAALAGRDAGRIRLVASPIAATGPDAETVAAERASAREVLAFTYSTPAYRATLDHHGWGHVHEELLGCTRQGRWGEMGALLSDDMLDVLVPTAPFDRIARLLLERYAEVAEGINLRMPADPSQDAAFAGVVEALRLAQV
jgi:probable F420-dependent oxidoreductase